MKKFTAALLLLALTAPQAMAAPKPIAVQQGSVYSAPNGSEGFIQSGKFSLYFQTVTVKTSDILLTARDLSNTQLWEKRIDSGLDEVATSATIDSSGNLWLAGAASITDIPESYTPIEGIDNPDMVIVETGTALRADMNQLAIWKVAPTGEVLATYYSQQSATPMVNAISLASSGISLIGEVGGKQFYISSTLTGTFSKPIFIGSGKSELTSVSRNADGTSYIIGNSAEKLVGKALAGLRDGILIKVSKTGAITSLLRSSAKSATRSWNSLDSSLLLTGPVVTGKVIETAITKFNASFAPIWTTRFSSAGPSLVASGGGNNYLAFTSRSSITGITQWKPSAPSLIVLTFDSKGVVKAAHAFSGLVTPLSLQFTRERGLVGMASGSDGLVSIFTLASR